MKAIVYRKQSYFVLTIVILILVIALLPAHALGQSCTYQVKRGDTASAIAASRGLTLGQLRSLNYGDPLTRIIPGQTLNVCIQRGVWSSVPTPEPATRSTPVSTSTPTAKPCRIYYDGMKIRITCE